MGRLLNTSLLFSSEKGSFTVMFALCLSLILILLSYVLDLGFFAKEKNRYMAAAEAAALAAVENMCYSTEDDLEYLVMNILDGFNLDLEDDAVTIEMGFYDAYDEYDEFLGRYQDFASALDYGIPDGEPYNAVMVTIGTGQTVQSISGFNEDKEILGGAVAYVPELDIVTRGDLDFEGANKISFNNGSVYAGKDIDLRGDNLDKNNIRMSASGVINKYTYTSGGLWFPDYWAFDGATPSEDLPEISLAENHMASVSDLVERLSRRADKVFTLSQRGPEFYEYEEENKKCFFDFTAENTEHQIIYIDLPATHTAYLTPYYDCGSSMIAAEYCVRCSSSSIDGYCGNRDAFGSAMSGLTIVATCDVKIPVYKSKSGTIITLGGDGFDNLNIITLGSINFSSHNNDLAGVNFVCQEDIDIRLYEINDYSPPTKNYIRVFSESDIKFEELDNDRYAQFNFHLSFGFQCPPLTSPVLGIFESVED